MVLSPKIPEDEFDYILWNQQLCVVCASEVDMYCPDCEIFLCEPHFDSDRRRHGDYASGSLSGEMYIFKRYMRLYPDTKG